MNREVSMTIQLTPQIKKLVERRAKAGKYASLQDVIVAGMAALEQQEGLSQLPADVLRKIVAEGDASLAEEGSITLAESYRQHLEHRQKRSRRQRKSA
jgi:antitoxin ParD1/3/4